MILFFNIYFRLSLPIQLGSKEVQIALIAIYILFLNKYIKKCIVDGV